MTGMTFVVRDVRKKPMVVQAGQWDGSVEGATAAIEWALSCGATIRYRCNPGCDGRAESHRLAIDTLEGTMLAEAGGWIIRGVQGEFYPITDDIFRFSYEFVEVSE